jgi:hypothetical protein
LTCDAPKRDHGAMSARASFALRILLLSAFMLPLAASSPPAFSVRVIDDPGASAACVDPAGLANPTADRNRMPQAEVALDVADDGRVAAAAKDFRYSPPSSIAYNDSVWNGLYLSEDGGASWRNLLFEDSDPRAGVSTRTGRDLGQAEGQSLLLRLETDPVVAFDGDGNLYTSALALGSSSASAVVLTRRDRQGRIGTGGMRFFGAEADQRIDNDKNWIAVERGVPGDLAVVVQSWRLFTYGADPPAEAGGWIAASADGAASFGPSLRLPVPRSDAVASQFYQPLVGRDPSGRRTLYVFFTVGDGSRLEMHLLRADLEGTRGDTTALAARLARSDGWTQLPQRLTGLAPYDRDGWSGDFRVASYFHPSLDPETGHLWVAFHALPPEGGPPHAYLSRSTDSGVSWSVPIAVDSSGRGAQLLPAIAARGGLASLVWYDSRNDPAYVPGGVIRGLDVYYAEMQADLSVRRMLRLTAETQSVAPLFRRARSGAAAAGRGERRPHDFEPGEADVRTRSTAEECDSELYGFLGDYVGLAVDAGAAYAAWGDLRDRSPLTDVCSGHDCRGNRNANIWFAQIPR